MKIIITDKQTKTQRINYIIDLLLYIVGYSLILITACVIFRKTIWIDNSMYGLWALVASLIIYVLNKTIKPLLIWMTLPITGLTLGVFYPFVNVIILYLTSLILGQHFIIHGILMSFIVAIFISIMNVFVELLIKKILKG